MENSNTLDVIILIICGASIILGFIALLTQKVYMDSQTRDPVEYEIPLLGKVKTNYPAIVFVVLGFALLAYKIHLIGEHEAKRSKQNWVITGSLTSPANNPPLDLSGFNINLHPTEIKRKDPGDGDYFIEVEIERGETFENKIEKIFFTKTDSSSKVIWKAEINPRLPGIILDSTGTTRAYKPIEVKICR